MKLHRLIKEKNFTEDESRKLTPSDYSKSLGQLNILSEDYIGVKFDQKLARNLTRKEDLPRFRVAENE